MVKQRLINKWIEKRFTKDGKPICLVPVCKDLAEKYKTTDNYRNYCKEHSVCDLHLFNNWQYLREEALKRGNYKCKKCGDNKLSIEIKSRKKEMNYNEWYNVNIQKEPKKSNIWSLGDERIITMNNLIVDHIKPIALGGEEFDINNLQILCYECNNVKTRNDIKEIAKLRAIEKKQLGNELLIEG